AQYSNALFLCEGWPLCLRDQVVVQLAPINPSLLQPGDFYLQVTPFCDQSARIVVCSLLKEEGLTVGVVEETPVPETSYPCIFSSGWLDELNQDRQGAPLRQCLVTTERGVVRLPWERVAVPDFVDLAHCAGSSMASAAPSHLPLTPPPLPDFSDTSSSNSFFPLSTSKESGHEYNPVTIQNSVLTSSPHPAAFSVETRICPAKHGIAVSLCLVDTRTSSSSQVVKVEGTETEHKPIGWVSPNTWDSRFTGTNQNPAAKTEKSNLSDGNIIDLKGGIKCVIVSKNTLQDKQKDSKAYSMSRDEPAAVATGEYIDILQAKMLFDKDQSITEEHQSIQIQTEVHRNPNWQNHPVMQAPFRTQSEVNSQTKSQDMSGDVGLSSVHDDSRKQQPFFDSLNPPQCVRTVRFAEKPCTPCMARRQGGNVIKTQELRCRYRDSYQAALQNPVTFGAENNRGNMLAVVEENTDTSQREDRFQMNPSSLAETHRTSQQVSARPRPHYLPLGSPDPKAHPVYLGLSYLTVNSLVLLVDKHNNHQPERCPGIQVKFFHSSKTFDRRHHAMSIVSEAERLQQSGLSYPETGVFRALICTFKSDLEDFLCRAEACGRELQNMVNLCDFCRQTASPGGQRLVVQSTPGPQHPQREGILPGAEALGKRKPVLDSNSPNSTTGRCSNIIIKPEGNIDAGTNWESKAPQHSPHRRGLAPRSVSQDSSTTQTPTSDSTPGEQGARPPSCCSHHGQPSCRILQEAQKFQISRHGSFCSDNSCVSDCGPAGGNGAECCKHSSLPQERYGRVFCLSGPQENASSAL
ncbi:hypothetical protein GOODEAATRI_015536, partial [Goodea atripinnis]